MQNLDVISINLWQVLISLCNLLLLFLILKKFLYQPVRKLLDQLFQEVKALFLVCKTSIRLKEQKRYSSNLGLTAALSSTISPALFNLSYSTFLSASTPFSRFIESFTLWRRSGWGITTLRDLQSYFSVSSRFFSFNKTYHSCANRRNSSIGARKTSTHVLFVTHTD